MVANCVDDFKDDLRNFDSDEILIKYIYNSENWYFKNLLGLEGEEYLQAVDLIQLIVSKSFETNFRNTQLVGSAKMGFSMAPYKIFREFNTDKSDLDIAVISEKYFQFCWERARTEMGTRFSAVFNEVTTSIFNGYVSTTLLEEVGEIRQAFNKYTDTARRLMSEELSIDHQINFRIYRSWNDLQDYHLKGIRKAQKTIAHNAS